MMMLREKQTSEAGFDQGNMGTKRQISIGKWIIPCSVVVDVLFNFEL